MLRIPAPMRESPGGSKGGTTTQQPWCLVCCRKRILVLGLSQQQRNHGSFGVPPLFPSGDSRVDAGTRNKCPWQPRDRPETELHKDALKHPKWIPNGFRNCQELVKWFPESVSEHVFTKMVDLHKTCAGAYGLHVRSPGGSHFNTF